MSGCQCSARKTKLREVPRSTILKGLAAIDAILVKAKVLPEWKRIIDLEKRLGRTLIASWEAQSKKAVREAVKAFKGTGKRVSASQKKKALKAIREAFAGFGERNEEAVKTTTEESFKLAIDAMNKKVQGKTRRSLRYDFTPAQERKEPVKKAPRIAPTAPGLEARFDVIDQRAVEQLTRRHTLWMDDFYSRELAESVEDLVSEVIVQHGDDPAVAARQLEAVLEREFGYDPANPNTGPYARVPVGWSRSAAAYFEGIAAHVVTTARVGGQLSALVSVGASTYSIVNPIDERTCEECAYMAQYATDMPVGEAYQAFQAEIDAEPEDIKDFLHPWMKVDGYQRVAGTSGAWTSTTPSKFIDQGLGYPPYHLGCRCTIDISPAATFA